MENDKSLRDIASSAAKDIAAYMCGRKQAEANYPTNRIEGLLEGLRESMQRRIDKANEDGELLAYNCEKRARDEMMKKACKSHCILCDGGDAGGKCMWSFSYDSCPDLRLIRETMSD